MCSLDERNVEMYNQACNGLIDGDSHVGCSPSVGMCRSMVGKHIGLAHLELRNQKDLRMTLVGLVREGHC